MRISRRGTTLPELLIVMAIMGVLLYVSQKVVVSGYEFYRTLDESFTLQREGLVALTRLTQDMAFSHHRSIEQTESATPIAPGQPDYEAFADHEINVDEVIIPLAEDVDGQSHVAATGADEGGLYWESVVAYQLDTASNDMPLMRYLADFKCGGAAEYPVNIELATLPTMAQITGYVDVRPRVAARHVLEFDLVKNVDTFDVELTIFLEGRKTATQSLDNSLTLKTTVFPKN